MGGGEGQESSRNMYKGPMDKNKKGGENLIWVGRAGERGREKWR